MRLSKGVAANVSEPSIINNFALGLNNRGEFVITILFEQTSPFFLIWEICVFAFFSKQGTVPAFGLTIDKQTAQCASDKSRLRHIPPNATSQFRSLCLRLPDQACCLGACFVIFKLNIKYTHHFEKIDEA